jgi:hypothetical protein|tara:strand:+ start:2780 stop:2974 length:195 start_codon:yes stop_codon:yes gene_type:complete
MNELDGQTIKELDESFDEIYDINKHQIDELYDELDDKEITDELMMILTCQYYFKETECLGFQTI